ncbi:Calvin cycle protein CP12 [Nodosilinea nodulosa]|uniref:Calvin cycle protein CP12 n=1 Tax=Nodosilinea nodulosa TaxID=416001 RepID=UPI0002DE1C53|nr:Calvin cycle protein CP12 [Nodosilinea nodulosa]
MSVDSKDFQDELQKAIDYAHQISAEKGETSSEAAAAWDVVEEMRAEVSHQHQKPKQTGFDKYLEENPDAPEGLMYDT